MASFLELLFQGVFFGAVVSRGIFCSCYFKESFLSCCFKGSFLELLFQGVFFGVVVSRGLFWCCCFKGSFLELLIQGVFVEAVAGIDVVGICGGGLLVVLIIISSNPLGLSTWT